MEFNKITTGFVVQEYDDTGHCIGQVFIAGDIVEYEDLEGNPVDDREAKDGYQPFDMVQPEIIIPKNIKDILKELESDCVSMFGIDKIAGGYASAIIEDVHDNGWTLTLTYGIQEGSGNYTTHQETYYLRKDTLKFTDDLEEIEMEQE